MKILFSSLFIAFVFLNGCKQNDPNAIDAAPCGYKGGYELPVTKGRVYQSADKSSYYIGNTDPARTPGGYIACNGIPRKFQKDGLLVEYNGIYKGAPPDTDPLFVYFVLKKIEEVK